MAYTWTKGEVTTIKDAFAKFAAKGNVLDLAVAVIIGGAFQAIVNSLVKDIMYAINSTCTRDPLTFASQHAAHRSARQEEF